MPTIPDFTALGPTPVPTPSYRRPMVDDSAARADEALAGVGSTIARAGEEGYAQQVNYARSQASNALIDHELAVKTQTESIKEQVSSGAIPWDQAQKTFNDWNAKQEPPQIDNLDPIGQEALAKGMKRNALGGQIAVQGIANTGRKQAFADTFDSTLNTLGKLAGMPNADIESINGQADQYRPMAMTAGIPAPVVDKAIQSFKDRNWLNQATQRSMEAKNDMGALTQLRNDLTNADGAYAGKLDTEKRDMVLRTVINDQLILQNRAEHEQDKREAKAQSAIGRIDEQISSGVPLSPDMWEKYQGLTHGTTFEDDFKQRMKDEDQVQSVLRMPIDQQTAYVQQRTQQLDQNGGSLRDRANLIRLQTAVNQNTNLMQKAPLLFAGNRNGTETKPLDFSALNEPNPIVSPIVGGITGQDPGAQVQNARQQFQDQIADRMATLKSLRTQYGAAIAPLPLLPQEAASLAGQLSSGTPQERTQMLVSLRGAMNDDQAYQSAMRQILPHSPVTAIAGTMIGSSAPASTPVWFNQSFAPSKSDVTYVLQGESLLNPKVNGKEGQGEQETGKGALKNGMPMPPDGDTQQLGSGLRTQFGRAAGDLFRDRPQLADAYFSVFKDAYAGLLAEKGDMKGTGDPRIAEQALKIALGNVQRFNGNDVSTPPGMDPTTFSGLVKNAVAQTATQLKAPADWADRIAGYGLKEIGALGSGQYELTQGNAPLMRPDGKGTFRVDLRDQYLAARGAHRSVANFSQGGDGLDLDLGDSVITSHTK